jgi:hypothetical protein
MEKRYGMGWDEEKTTLHFPIFSFSSRVSRPLHAQSMLNVVARLRETFQRSSVQSPRRSEGDEAAEVGVMAEREEKGARARMVGGRRVGEREALAPSPPGHPPNSRTHQCAA